jgi:hypothetical protein
VKSVTRTELNLPTLVADLDRYTRLLEMSKLRIDFLKHLATLTSGSIVVISTLLARITDHTHARILIGISVGCLLLSLLASIVSIQSILRYTQTLLFTDSSSESNFEKCRKSMKDAIRDQTVSHFFFMTGIVLLGVFVWRNL